MFGQIWRELKPVATHFTYPGSVLLVHSKHMVFQLRPAYKATLTALMSALKRADALMLQYMLIQ